MAGLAWTLKLFGLVIVGTGLLVGLMQDALRVEVAMLAIGAFLFLVGHRLEKSP